VIYAHYTGTAVALVMDCHPEDEAQLPLRCNDVYVSSGPRKSI